MARVPCLTYDDDSWFGDEARFITHALYVDPWCWCFPPRTLVKRKKTLDWRELRSGIRRVGVAREDRRRTRARGRRRDSSTSIRKCGFVASEVLRAASVAASTQSS